MYKALILVLFNGAFAVVSYFAFYENIQGALNVVLVFAWINIALSFFLLSDKALESLSKQGRSVPAFFNIAYDLIFASIFAWYGHEVLAVFWIIHLFLQEAAWAKINELKMETK